MSHARQQIREAVETALAGITSATKYTSRVYPLISLPAISIYTRREDADDENELLNTTRRYTRRLELTVEIAAEAISGVDDTVDTLAVSVEEALESDRTLGGACTDIRQLSWSMDLSGDAEKPIALARLVYEIWYRTLATDVENAL